MKFLPLLLTAILALAGLGMPTGHAQNIEAKLEAERLAQSGVAITIIFDDSGSMAQNNKMAQAKAAFAQWLEGIPAETKLGLVTLNRGVLVPLGQNTREKVQQVVATIQPTGGTPLTRTINGVGKLIAERRATVTPYERQIVVVFTDGEDSEFKNQDVVNSLRNLSRQTIESVGIGFHGQGDYMQGGATQYFNASDTTSLVKALQEVASEIDQQSDLVITPEIEAEMANAKPKKLSLVETNSAETVATAAPSSGLPVAVWILIGIVAFFVVILGLNALFS